VSVCQLAVGSSSSDVDTGGVGQLHQSTNLVSEVHSPYTLSLLHPIAYTQSVRESVNSTVVLYGGGSSICERGSESGKGGKVELRCRASASRGREIGKGCSPLQRTMGSGGVS